MTGLYLIAVMNAKSKSGVIFDRIGGVKTDAHDYLVAWSDGRITSEDGFDLTFLHFLSDETEANAWLANDGDD